jgi:hypothetical protein
VWACAVCFDKFMAIAARTSEVNGVYRPNVITEVNIS